jgi:hypothetical protein
MDVNNVTISLTLKTSFWQQQHFLICIYKIYGPNKSK